MTMHLAHQQEEFSRAFVHAVASAAGLKVQLGALPDNDSVDLTVHARGNFGQMRSPRVDIQLKSWLAAAPTADFRYRLKIKNYEDLRAAPDELQCPRILVVVVVPEDPQTWVEAGQDVLTLRHCAYWVSLAGEPSVANTSTVNVTIPLSNRFDPASLQDLMLRIGRGVQL